MFLMMSIPTRFTFDSPVYLTDDIEYAFLIKVDKLDVVYSSLKLDRLT